MKEKTKGRVEEKEKMETEPEIKEFVRRTDSGNQNNRNRHYGKSRRRDVDYQSCLWLAGFVIVWIAAIVCGILLCKVPLVTVILVAILETALALCLCRSPLWLHGLVVIVNIVLGAIFGLALFMILGSIVYMAGITLMYLVIKNHQRNK